VKTIYFAPAVLVAGLMLGSLAGCGGGGSGYGSSMPPSSTTNMPPGTQPGTQPVTQPVMQPASGTTMGNIMYAMVRPDDKTLTRREKTMTAGSYQDILEQLYVAYYGRPADPAGMAYWEGVLLAANAPTTIEGLNAAYPDPGVKTVVDSFGNSAESVALYGTGNSSGFINAIYENILARSTATDLAGANYWNGLLANGTMTQAQAALAILSAAASEPTSSTDEQVVANRLAVANYFTAQITAQNASAAYSGSAANAPVRLMLGSVVAGTDTTAFDATVNSTIASLVASSQSNAFAPIQAIITQRCVPCHSSHPTEPGYSVAPLGYMFDTSTEIHANADIIYQVVVVGRPIQMPYGNATGMTQSERTSIAAWYNAGAQ